MKSNVGAFWLKENFELENYENLNAFFFFLPFALVSPKYPST